MTFINHIFHSIVNIYSRVFHDSFSTCEPYIVHDFLNIGGTKAGNTKYCFFTYKKIFEEIIKTLDKSKYNGEIILPKQLVFNYDNIIPMSQIVNNSVCLLKNKITIQNDIIKLTNAKIADIKHRMFIIPIDGLSAFANGNSDFSIVFILQQELLENENQFELINVSVFNPIRKDITVFDKEEGCKYNGKKIALDDVHTEKRLDVIFCNNDEQKISFDLTTLAQKSNSLSLSSSIFSSIVNLLITNKNLCIAKINPEFELAVEFMCRHTLLTMHKIGNHYAIGKKDIIDKLIKK